MVILHFDGYEWESKHLLAGLWVFIDGNCVFWTEYFTGLDRLDHCQCNKANFSLNIIDRWGTMSP